MTSPARFQVLLQPLPASSELAALWQSVEARAQGSFFTSWSWIGPWLEMLAATNARADLSLLRVQDGSDIVGLAILCRGPRSLSTLGRRSFFLNQTGRHALDTSYIEYNDILLVHETADEARAACLRSLSQLSGLRVNAAIPAMAKGMADAGLPFNVGRRELCDYVDLTTINAKADTLESVPHTFELLLETLSRNARQQIRRATRLAQANGDLQVTRASNIQDAQAMLAEMVDLHTQAWNHRKGLPGAYANPHFNQFVTGLIRAGVDTGTVDLLHIGTPTTTLGILLNFVYCGEVYAYQSGFAYIEDNRFKPGLVCHALAIAHYLRRGCRGYHFMAGAGRYKQTLSNAQESLVWLDSRPNTFLTRVEDLCRALWHTIRPRPNT